jgi:hypothetical protein
MEVYDVVHRGVLVYDHSTLTSKNAIRNPLRVRFHGMLELEGIEGRRAGKTNKQ